MLATFQCRIFCLPAFQEPKINLYKIIILPVVLGCNTWYLAPREEHRFRVFENRVLRRIFGRKTGDWREMHVDEIHNV
jgi:hypothetical protein